MRSSWPAPGVFYHSLTVGDLVTLDHVDLVDGAIPGGTDDIVHLHGLDDQQLIA